MMAMHPVHRGCGVRKGNMEEGVAHKYGPKVKRDFYSANVLQECLVLFAIYRSYKRLSAFFFSNLGLLGRMALFFLTKK